MDKKKLAQMLTLAGGVLMIILIILWLIPTIGYTVVDTGAAASISPLGYFVQGSGSKVPFYQYLIQQNADYNTNSDMYWIAFGALFTIAQIIITFAGGKKTASKVTGMIFGAFMLAGVIVSSVLHMSTIWALYLVVALLVFAAYVVAWIFDYWLD